MKNREPPDLAARGLIVDKLEICAEIWLRFQQ